MGPGQEPAETPWEQHEEDTGAGARAKSFPVTSDVLQSWLGWRSCVLLQVQGSTFLSQERSPDLFSQDRSPAPAKPQAELFWSTPIHWEILDNLSSSFHPTSQGSCCFSSWMMAPR